MGCEEVSDMNVIAEWASGGPWHLIFPLFWLGVIIFLVFRFRPGRRGHWQTHTAQEVLAERYARGEISVEEYRQRLEVLERKAR
jgi:putative membrane protein